MKISEFGILVLDLLNEVREGLVNLLNATHLHALEGRIRRNTDSDSFFSDSFDDGIDNRERETAAVLE